MNVCKNAGLVVNSVDTDQKSRSVASDLNLYCLLRLSVRIRRVSTVTVNRPLSEIIFITKTYLYNFDPLKPHFYTVKLGFTGVYVIFLISAQKHRLWVLVRTASARRF